MENIKPPAFKLMERNYNRAKNNGEKSFKKYLRAASGNYIKKESVKRYIFNKYDNKCSFCGTSSDLQIDHIISVYRIVKDNIPIEEINNVNNLQLLCKKCNAGKAP